MSYLPAVINALDLTRYDQERPDRAIPTVANTILEALTRASGVEAVLQNPLIQETIYNTASVLAVNRLTIAEAPFFGHNTTEDLSVRAAIVQNAPAEATHFWKELAGLSKRDLRVETGSAARRWNYVLRHEIVRTMLGQTLRGIDWLECMERPTVCIVNLGLFESEVSDQTQRFLGALVQAQIVAAARQRKKNHASPCYLAIDEFSRFCSYDTLEATAELRGFGIRALYSYQRLDQAVLEPGDDRLKRALMSLPNKILFPGGLTEDQLELAKQVWAPHVDLDKVKLRHRAFAPKLREVDLHAYSDTETEGEVTSELDADGTANVSSQTAGTVTPPTDGFFIPDPTTTTSAGRAHTEQRTRASGRGTSRLRSRGHTVTKALVTDHEEYSQIVQYESPDEQIYRAMQNNIRRDVGQGLFVRGFNNKPEPLQMPDQPPILLDHLVERYLEDVWNAHPNTYIEAERGIREIEERKLRLLEAARPQVEIFSKRPIKRRAPTKLRPRS